MSKLSNDNVIEHVERIHFYTIKYNDMNDVLCFFFLGSCWIGLIDYDADDIYIWNDGILENISNMYWSPGVSTCKCFTIC